MMPELCIRSTGRLTSATSECPPFRLNSRIAGAAFVPSRQSGGNMNSVSPMHSETHVLPDGGLFIGGSRISNSSVGRRPHINPSTGKPTKDFTFAGRTEIDQAVRAAQAALPSWKRLGASERRRFLLRI